MLLNTRQANAEEKLTVTFLELQEHGLAIVLRTPKGQTYLIDTGGSSKDYNAGRDTISPFLRSQGISEIAGIAISHPHGDHYGGASWLLENYRVGEFVDTGYRGDHASEDHRQQMVSYESIREHAKQYAAKYVAVQAGDRLSWGEEIAVDILSPPKNFFLQNVDTEKHSAHAVINANSLLIRVKYGKHTFMFPGDAYGSIGEYLLTIPRKELITTVLAAPHHGFNPSSFPELTRPEVVVTSSVRDYPGNAHKAYPRSPGDNATIVFGEVGSQVWNTSRHGNVTIESDGNTYQVTSARQAKAPDLRIDWDKNFLTLRGDFPGGEIRVHYLEAYCRAGSTNRDWKETVIGHQTELVSISKDHRRIQLKCTLSDGVIVNHDIAAIDDEIDFRIRATNPTSKPSQVNWAQPCIRLDRFVGVPSKFNSEAYLPRSFIFLNNQLTRLPTSEWATQARYVPGQVWAPKNVDRNDVNPRPLSDQIPSNGLIGCYSSDDQWIFATAFEPYQELFQGVIVCLHSDFRIGGLAPGESKNIRGKVYVCPADVTALVNRYQKDFSEHRSRLTAGTAQ